MWWVLIIILPLCIALTALGCAALIMAKNEGWIDESAIWLTPFSVFIGIITLPIVLCIFLWIGIEALKEGLED